MIALRRDASCAAFICRQRSAPHARQWVVHFRQVLEHIELTLSSVIDAETGQRGYLLTGDETLLAPYRSSLATLPGTLQELERLIKDNPVQQAALIQVRSEIEDKLALLGKALALFGRGELAAAAEFVRLGGGASIMEKRRADLTNMRAVEERLLTLRSAFGFSQGGEAPMAECRRAVKH